MPSPIPDPVVILCDHEKDLADRLVSALRKT